MFLDMLKPNNTEFQEAVDKFIGLKSKRLKEVITALEKCQQAGSKSKWPGQLEVAGLLGALSDWRTKERHEYKTRGGKHGVAYRLWMEAKQLIRNVWGTGKLLDDDDDPPIPDDCPGTTLLGVYVPEGEEIKTREICHGFAYRWLVAAGKLRETIPAGKGLSTFNNQSSLFLYPGGVGAYPAARVGGVVQLQPGDLVGMFLQGELGHSLIAVTPMHWFASNNAGTFGVGVGRTLIDFNQGFPQMGGGPAKMVDGELVPGVPVYQPGWTGTENKFKRVTDGVDVDVIYRRL
jgi:hypothetical protein